MTCYHLRGSSPLTRESPLEENDHCIVWPRLPLSSRESSMLSGLQVMEVEAFCGVHDMIHAAILSYGSQASLREVSVANHEAAFAI